MRRKKPELTEKYNENKSITVIFSGSVLLIQNYIEIHGEKSLAISYSQAHLVHLGHRNREYTGLKKILPSTKQ